MEATNEASERPADNLEDPLVIDLTGPQQRLEGVQRAEQQGVSQAVARMKSNNRVPAPSQETGAHQRLQMRVPTAGTPDGTVISAGHRSAQSFDGYGVKTIGHVSMSAEGGVAASTMTLQANGQVMVQSDQASLFLLSTAPATLASASVTNVAGAGVVIAAGGGAPVMMLPIGGAGPSTPASVAAASSSASSTASSWSGWDQALSGTAQARDELRRTMDPGASGYSAQQSGSTARSVLVDGNSAGASSSGGAGGLVLHGERALLVGTPGVGAVRAGEALTISSNAIAQVAHHDLEIVAGGNLSATVSESTSVMTKKRVDVVAHEDRVHVASRVGAGVEVQGAALMLGETTPREPQHATEHVFVRSGRHVSVTTDIDSAREHRADGIHLESHDHIAARSETQVTVEAAQKITLRIAEREIDLTVDASGNIVLRAKNAVLEVSERGGVSIGHQNAELFRGRSNRVTMGTGTADKLEIASGAVTLKGGSIKIG